MQQVRKKQKKIKLTIRELKKTHRYHLYRERANERNRYVLPRYLPFSTTRCRFIIYSERYRDKDREGEIYRFISKVTRTMYIRLLRCNWA